MGRILFYTISIFEFVPKNVLIFVMLRLLINANGNVLTYLKIIEHSALLQAVKKNCHF